KGLAPHPATATFSPQAGRRTMGPPFCLLLSRLRGEGPGREDEGQQPTRKDSRSKLQEPRIERRNTMTPQTRVKERAEEQASAMTADQQAMIRMVANDLHRLNQSVMKAVDAGVSVELVRSARHHGGDGNWGD